MPVYAPSSSLDTATLLALLAEIDQPLVWSGYDQDFNLAYLYGIGGTDQLNLLDGGSVYGQDGSLTISALEEIILQPGSPATVRFNYAALLEINEIDVNGELTGGAGLGIDIYGFHFSGAAGPILDTNGNYIANGNQAGGSLLQGTNWNTGAFILGNSIEPGDGYIHGSNIYIEADNFGVFGGSSSQASAFANVYIDVGWTFHTNYPSEAITLEDTAQAVNHCLDTLRAFGFIAS